MNRRFDAVIETRSQIGKRVHVIFTGSDAESVWSRALATKNEYGVEHAPRLFGLEKSRSGLWFAVLVEQEAA
jgi:hypothetical protein